MRLSPFAPEALPATIATWVAFAPPVAAIAARRSFVHEPAGRIALCWLAMAVIGAVQFFGFFVFGTNVPVVGRTIDILFPLLLLPPTLHWIGGSARRWQWPLLAGWVLLWLAGAVGLPGARPFRTIVEPVMSIGLGVATVWALAAQVQRAPWRLSRTDWFWILLAHVLYFVIGTVRAPLFEALVANHWDVRFQVYTGIQLLYCAVYLMLARGMMMRAPVSAPPTMLSVSQVA